MGCKVKHWVKLFLNTGARPLRIIRVMWILRFAGKGWGKRYYPEPHSSSPVWFQSFQVVIYPALGHFQMHWSEIRCMPTTSLRVLFVYLYFSLWDQPPWCSKMLSLSFYSINWQSFPLFWLYWDIINIQKITHIYSIYVLRRWIYVHTCHSYVRYIK